MTFTFIDEDSTAFTASDATIIDELTASGVITNFDGILIHEDEDSVEIICDDITDTRSIDTVINAHNQV